MSKLSACTAGLLLLFVSGTPAPSQDLQDQPHVAPASPTLPFNPALDPKVSEQQARVHAEHLQKKLVGFFDEHHAQSELPADTVDAVHRILGDVAKWAAHTQHVGRPRPDDWPDRKALLPVTKALLDSGFSDPLFWGAAGAMQKDDTGNRLRSAMSGARHMRAMGYPPEATLLVADLGLLLNWAKNERWQRTPSLNQYRDELFRDLAAWCRTPGPIDPTLEHWWANLAVRLGDELSIEQAQAAYAAFAEDASDRDDKAWLRHLARGSLAVEEAWEHRGGGWSSTVTDEGWAGFGRSLQRAAADLKIAHQARPHLPQAATVMIKVAMGRGTGDEYKWFELAKSADPFDEEPWDSLAWALRPRWGGSYEAVLDLGLRAAAEGPAGSRVPGVLTDAIDDILTDDGQDWLVQHQFRWLPALTRQLERAEATGASLRAVGSLAYAVAFKSGDDDKALRLYQMLEPDPEREGTGRGVGRTTDFGVDKRWDAGLAAIRLSPQANAALDRAKRESRGQPEDAAAILRAAALEAERPLVHRALSDLALAHERQAAYDRGEPVNLLSHGIDGWRVSRGWFESVPEGGVKAHHRKDGGSRLISTLDLGKHYEAYLELTPPDLWGGRTLFAVTGLQFGVQEIEKTNRQTGIYFESKGLLETRTRDADGDYHWTTVDRLTHGQTGGRPTTRIYVRRFGNQADLYHNGVPVQRDWAFRELIPGGPLALGLYWNHRGREGVHDPVHYRNLWVRKLDRTEVSKRAEEDPDALLHQHAAYDAVVESSGAEPRWNPPGLPEDALPTDPIPVADSPTEQLGIQALYTDAWTHSFDQTEHAQADWAPAARQLIGREAIRMAGAVDAYRMRPPGYLHRDEERPEAQRLLDAGAREDLLIRALCRALLVPDPINRSAPYNEPQNVELLEAGHTEMANLLRRRRAWLHEPDYRPWAWVKRGENNSLWPEREQAARALSSQADWLAEHPQHAAPLVNLIQPRSEERQERHANHWRRVSAPAIEAGGTAEWSARALRLAYDTAAARSIIEAWYDSSPAHRHDSPLLLALELLSRAETEASAAWPLATRPEMRAHLAGLIAEAAMDSARAVTGLGRPEEAYRLSQNSEAWFLTAVAATPLDTRLFSQRRSTINRLQEAGGVLAGEALPPHDDLEAWANTYRHTWEAHLAMSQMPAARRIGAAQISLTWWHFWPSTPDDGVIREHLYQASRAWLRGHGDTALEALLSGARRLQHYPVYGEQTRSRYGQAVSLARWLDQPERASQIMEEAGGPDAVGDLGVFGLHPTPAPRALQAAYDAGETIDLMGADSQLLQTLRGRLDRVEHEGRPALAVPAGYPYSHWVYCPLEVGDRYRISYTVVDPGGWFHTSQATSSVGVAFNTGPGPVLPNFRALPYIGFANNHSVAISHLDASANAGFRWGTGHGFDLLEKANLQGPIYRVVIENRHGTLSLRVNDILAHDNQVLPGGQSGGGFAIGFSTHYSIEVPAVRITQLKVQKILPAAAVGNEGDTEDAAPKPERKRAPRAPY